ncbi:alpha-glucuronidase [Streptomyces avermitilis]|uniref:Alpha-glucuronidase n=2 Tax=Streptomyces avermitilis TaxID=33903 RepID=Q82N53_STRAW|nr:MULTISPECIES: alpha-glucuronidase [Streptomyces]KUN55130.1 alpha-glucuronidase [Streptomyces avermitilis]MYS97081.1 alpha-glucuronidase [Streptomyces sp. SID5469]OOV26762.1 alpha-glucuronidase [Streptomyces avermitilis]BAC69160.1 putative alpha-glucuronidase [Streptomyces avermitilis MA-4680 = NBRC 14893]BBJ49114.1 xylan alpha-(1->2)-glucuronosidase [Streptomyces avermitilis]
MRRSARTAPAALTPLADHVDPAWLPSEAFRALGSRRTVVCGTGALVDTVHGEVAWACGAFGGSVVRAEEPADDRPCDLLLHLGERLDAPEPLGDEGFTLVRRRGRTTVTAAGQRGLLYGLFHVVRLGEAAFGASRAREAHRPALASRMLDHWDNVAVHPVMGQVERGYAGGSLFWRDGRARGDLERVRTYGRLLAACGINAVAVNNVNVHATEAHLLTDRIGEVAEIAGALRPYGIRTQLSVTFAAPLVLGGLATADPLDEAVRAWWAEATGRVYAAIPDFGGYVVKADSEGQPGPFAYGRSHADGANLLADALAPYGGTVHWRAFVYDHRQDWRDRSTDRARAAYDHFVPLDGRFRDNAVLQVKHGPMDFQVREPVSPVIGAMPRTRLAVEVQATQEYTGQQRHVCALAPMWSQVLRWRPEGATGTSVGELARGGLVAVSNAGDDPYWTGHPLAQANLYTVGRLGWQPDADPFGLLDEWIDLTFTPARTEAPERLVAGLRAVLYRSWRTYEKYTAPLGVGFMVQPGHHYGPSVDGYEYSPWGTYHFADRDGVGVDRTRATGTGYAGQYAKPWAEVYESPDTCPDELLLFFHHVPYGHVLHSGRTVIQHIYDTHFEGVAEVEEARQVWASLVDLVEPARHTRVAERYEEQLRGAREWRDHINSYFFRKSGVPDAHGRRIH